MKKFNFRRAFGGGGKRHEARDIVCGAGEAAKFLKDDRAIRREDDKSETEKVVLVDSSNEHESIVGWGCEIADEWLTRGARNEIHICDSNMNGSYEREAISRRYPNNEKLIQSSPSPEFLNSLPFIKKFYPTPRWGDGKVSEIIHENSSNTCHSERLAKNLRNIVIRFFGLKLLLSSE